MRAPTLPASASPWGAPPASFAPREPIQWNHVWQGALFAGVGAALLSSIPFLALGSLLWLLIAGALSVSLYQRRVPTAIVRAGMGMRIGAMAGVFAFAITAMLCAAVFATAGNQFWPTMQEQLQASIPKSADPQTVETLQKVIASLSTPQGLIMLLLWTGVIFVIFSAAGGALRASLSTRRR